MKFYRLRLTDDMIRVVSRLTSGRLQSNTRNVIAPNAITCMDPRQIL